MEYRIEHDSMGEMKVPADRLWAAQTQRSHENFEIGVGIETMPAEIIHAFGVLKKAAALANNRLKPEKMTDAKLSAISKACDEVMSGSLNDQFPLVVWQTGSGTQSNMNANEVIANRGNQIAGEKLAKEGVKDALTIKATMMAILTAEPLANVEYVELVDFNTLQDVETINGPILTAIAVRIGTTRLIDNFIIM